ncbi:MAG: histidine phosphatase family protein [Hyphomicrobiaceae bacterium]|nr:histidine phosphatase family protein [Hyphomicrobiaceae bacterium]
MLTLLLLRHAKSSWDDPGIDDFDRPLTKRGTKAAAAIGQYIDKARLAPGLVLCSTAVRTRATLTLVLREIDCPAPQVVFEESFYLAPASVLLDRLRECDGRNATVLIVAHNPGIHALALELAGDGSRENLSALAMQFPTAALARLTFRAPSWSTVLPATGELVDFVIPKKLD